MRLPRLHLPQTYVDKSLGALTKLLIGVAHRNADYRHPGWKLPQIISAMNQWGHSKLAEEPVYGFIRQEDTRVPLDGLTREAALQVIASAVIPYGLGY